MVVSGLHVCRMPLRIYIPALTCVSFDEVLGWINKFTTIDGISYSKIFPRLRVTKPLLEHKIFLNKGVPLIP